MSETRTIHGKLADGRWLVHYGRAKKWFVESYGDNVSVRVDLATAVRMVTEPGAVPYFGVDGGLRFDAEVRKVLRARAA